MAMKIKAPAFRASNYERYRLELEAWREVTDLDKTKQGIAIALTLPEDDDSGIRDKVFDELSLTDLKAENGFDKLLTFFDSKLKKDDSSDSWEKFNDFEEFKREKEQSITDYISKFDQKYNKIVKKGMQLPSEILAFKLLKRASLNHEEHLLVLTGMDYSKQTTLYEQAKSSLKKFKGDQVSEVKAEFNLLQLESANVTEDALFTGQFQSQSNRGSNKVFNGQRGRGGRRISRFNNGPSTSNSNTSSTKRRLNPKNADGQLLTCISCGSYRHLLADCPDSWENLAKSQASGNANFAGCLFTGTSKNHLQQLNIEAASCAVLDSACSSTVCGKFWLQHFIQSLNEDDKKKIQQMKGERTYKFGGGEILTSLGNYNIPVILAGKEVIVNTDVVDSNIPLLLSLTAMKKAGITLDLVNDCAEIFGKSVSLNYTSSGHYCVPITREVSAEAIYAVSLSELPKNECYTSLLKLHRQFAHPSQQKFASFLKDGGVWTKGFESHIAEIYDRCEICKLYKKTPPRPVVSLPMASRFNEKVAMDLKKWGDKWILHLIDMWSRFTVSKFISRKKPSEVIDAIMVNWVGAGFGIMESILSDNGGEFTSDEIREVASILNIETITTAAESSFQNGICERNHAVTDMMLLKLKEQCSNTPLDVLLAWANTAKNSLQMWHGFSSYQLVFGQNPNIPNVMSSNVSALEGSTTSEVLAKHLNAMQQARQAFIQSESSERIRRALRSKVRVSEQVYKAGDSVFYKRDGHDRWLGPARVVFQDGKVIFIRHGSVFVRVSPNRVIKTGEEFAPDGAAAFENTTRGGDFERPTQQSQASNFEELIPKSSPMSNPTTSSDSVEKESVVQQSNKQQIPELRHPKKNDVIHIKNDDDSWKTVRVLSRAGKASGKHKDWFNVSDTDNNTESVNLDAVQWKHDDTSNVINEVLITDDANSQEILAAKLDEIKKLKDFDTFDEVPDIGQFRISTTWVITTKDGCKRARLVARGYEENLNERTDSPTISKNGLRVFLSVCSNMNWTVKTTDIKSAFLQGKPIVRNVFVQPPKEAQHKNKVWKLKRCLYGLTDAARQFYVTVAEVLKQLKCIQSQLDPAMFFFKSTDGVVHGIIICHVDDFLHAGDEKFDAAVIRRLHNHFTAGRCNDTQFPYIGFLIKQYLSEIVINQDAYINEIEVPVIASERSSQKTAILQPDELSLLRTLVGKLNWLVQGSRPDLAFDVIELSTKFKSANVNDLIRSTKCLRKAKTSACCLCFPHLGVVSEWKLVIFSDASHANLVDGVSSMGGHVLFLIGSEQRCCTLSWHSNKIKRVVRSTLAAETLSLQTALEDAIFHRTLLQEIFGTHILLPITAFVDSRSVIEAIQSTKMVDDKRLRIDLGAIKEAIKDENIQLRWCPGAVQLANCLTKRGAQSNQLLHVIQRGKLHLDNFNFT